MLVLAARQTDFLNLLEDAGYEVELRTRPLDADDVETDVAVVFRGRLLGRNQAVLLTERGIPVIEVLTAEPTSPSVENWVRLSHRVAKPDLVQVVHAVAAWARSRDRAASAA